MGIIKKIADETKKNMKQGIGDALDTISRVPTRLLGLAGNKPSKNSLGAKNFGEASAVELARRAKSAGGAAIAAFKGKAAKKMAMKK